MRAAYLAGAAMLGLGAWMLYRPASAATGGGEEGGSLEGAAVDWLASMDQLFGGDEVQMSAQLSSVWRAPEKYRPAIQAAEYINGIPAGMLERLLWQESRYREDIITGRVRSPVGALGIAQFMPATAAEMGIDPLNPEQAIPAAGRYLAQLYRRFGTWEQALAAYNWGQGNVARKGLAAAPAETRNYFSQILADLGLA